MLVLIFIATTVYPHLHSRKQQDDLSALMWASFHGQSKLARMLLDKGINPNAQHEVCMALRPGAHGFMQIS